MIDAPDYVLDLIGGFCDLPPQRIMLPDDLCVLSPPMVTENMLNLWVVRGDKKGGSA